MSSDLVCPVFPAEVRSHLSLEERARLAVGKDNLYNISPSIPLDKLKHIPGGIGLMYPVLVPCLDGENAEKAAWRLSNDESPYILGNIGELADFVAQYAGFISMYPEEAAKYSDIFALDKDSRWNNREGNPCVAYASVEDLKFCFRSYRVNSLLTPRDGIIVFDKKRASHRPVEPAAPPEEVPPAT